MICSKCGNECEVKSGVTRVSADGMEGNLVVSVCCNARVIMGKENNMEWKDLEIGNIPSDFFVNEGYEIRNRYKENEWYPSDNQKLINRTVIVKNMIEDSYYEYQYRLKPLEAIRIPRDLCQMLEVELIQKGYYDLLHATSDGLGNLKTIQGRPIEIIEE